MDGCIALVVGAGRGERFGGEVPKQYATIGDETVLARTLRALGTHPAVSSVRAVIHPDHHDLYKTATANLGDRISLLDPVDGGATRQDSVRLGLESLAKFTPSRVLVHDAARPFASRDMIGRVIAALEDAPGAVPALGVIDTLKRAGTDKTITQTVPREGLYRAQTPQGFHYAAILEAHRRHAGDDLTDDAAVMEAAGGTVKLVEGDGDNIKITTPDDMTQATRILGGGTDGGETRTGFGFDVHRFGPGDHVMLLGVAVPFNVGLAGHSDADVALHALTDAVLGAGGLGDIGQHFPPSDSRWAGQSSDLFLKAAAEKLAGNGGRIVNVDVTVICEAPKIGSHRDAMRARVAEILGLAPEKVNIKGTTTEGLGFTGRGEGIAAQAVATAYFTTPD